MASDFTRSETQVSQAVRLAHLAYWEDDFVTNQISWSAEGSHILGLPVDERSRSWEAFLALVHPDDRALTNGAREKAVHGESGYRLGHRVVRPDGEVRHVVVIIDVITDHHGRPTRAVGAAQDITDLRQAERAEALYRALIDRTNDMVEVVDPETGRILEANEQACRVHGFTREEYLSFHIADLDPILGDPAIFARNIEHLRRSGSLTVEGQHRRKDGTVFPVEVSLTYVRLDRDYLLSVVRDISERKDAEAALTWSQERLHLALQAAGLGPWDWNLRTNEVAYAPEWKRQLGYEPDEMANRYDEWESRLHPDDREQVLAALKAYLEGGRSEFALELRMRHKDGSYRWIYTRGVAVPDTTGNLSHMLGYHLDITQRKQLEEQFRQAQKMQAFGQLAGGVAHDFNNVLTVISGYSEMLVSLLPSKDPALEMASEIHAAAERAAGLTRQLLAFSRQTLLEPKVLALDALVHESEKMLRRVIGEDVVLTTSLDTASEQVRVDPGQISQVLMNLAVNARDAMPTGGQLTIETRAVTLDETAGAFGAEARRGRYVVMSVSDTGIGMPPDIKARIFEPFFTTKERGKGTGLGLATIYGIVQQSGGFIAVDSEPGHGSTFRLYFPIADWQPPKAGSGVESVRRGTETILLVEDEEAVRTMTRRMLERAGYTVLDADRGSVALNLVAASTGRIDLLITDVVMPGMGGRELVEHISRSWPNLKVLYLSGYTDDAVVRHGVLQADVAFLQKPFTMAALTGKVRAVLDAQR